MIDKYGVGQDPDCYVGSTTLINLLEIQDDQLLEDAEHELSSLAAQEIEWSPPPYDFNYLRKIHYVLFADVYVWAGEIRRVDISKGDTRFCHVGRIQPEVEKLFTHLKNQHDFVGLIRQDLVIALAEFYSDLNVVHPFRDGNGRAQRMLFEHLIINCGYAIDWSTIQRDEWIQANIEGFYGHLDRMIEIFDRCVGGQIEDWKRFISEDYFRE